MRKHGRTDANQSEIVEAFRKSGASVEVISDKGDGVPDLLIGYRKRTALVEVKNGNGDLTPDQVKFLIHWAGGTVHIARTVDDVPAILKRIARGRN